MKTSARNHFTGTVSAVRAGAINDEIELEIAENLSVVATVTHESTTELGLKAGARAFALVKASAIVLMTECEDVILSARNQFKGRVTQLTDGAVNSEVILELIGGASLAAIVTRESAKDLGLAVGVQAVAIFKASSVIVGVNAKG